MKFTYIRDDIIGGSQKIVAKICEFIKNSMESIVKSNVFNFTNIVEAGV